MYLSMINTVPNKCVENDSILDSSSDLLHAPIPNFSTGEGGVAYEHVKHLKAVVRFLLTKSVSEEKQWLER